METLLEYIADGHSFSDFITTVIVIAAIVVAVAGGFQWIYKGFTNLYNIKKNREKKNTTIEENTGEIKKLSEDIHNLGNLLNQQYQHLDKKIDAQKEHLEQINKEGKDRDCAILRDRILSSMKKFSQNKDENGIVHILVSDHENISHLFEAYFSCDGNGTVKSMYDNEFKKWIIDNYG